ncbi:hypothetical protein [Neorhizobium sp. T25_27]|uniref:hypothetical protein n=1 Tax=Neorhizobium sp. T25_27 TaxID=2093831 RepID=UPI000CF8F796|nr:hypothetical protein [Neorhizobium sp. T25_27]
MRKIRVRIQHTHHIHIHNDLASAAFFFRNKVMENSKIDGSVKGSHFDMMACVTMTAFALEAKINFLGDRLLGRKWRERDSSYEKLKKVCRHVGVTLSLNAKPFTAFTYLKDIRDTLAHGKPELIEVDKEVVSTPHELEAYNGELQGQWEYQIKPDLVLNAYDEAMDVWKLLLEASGLSLHDTLTHGIHGISYIEDVLIDGSTAV